MTSAGLVRRGLVQGRLLAKIDAGASKAVGSLIRDDDLDGILRKAIGAGESIEDVARRLNKSRRMIRWHIERLVLTPLPGDKTRINPEQLRTLYVEERRTAQEIADITGWSKTTIRRSLCESGTLMRSRGSGSGSIGISAERLRGCPVLLRKTLTGPRSRQRLQRFVAVMSYPTLGEAAEALNLNGTALVRQFGHLEGEVEGKLFVRATRHHPMHLTPLGHELIRQALNSGVLDTSQVDRNRKPTAEELGTRVQ
jgi:AraC-like DNA-binding protein